MAAHHSCLSLSTKTWRLSAHASGVFSLFKKFGGPPKGGGGPDAQDPPSPGFAPAAFSLKACCPSHGPRTSQLEGLSARVLRESRVRAISVYYGLSPNTQAYYKDALSAGTRCFLFPCTNID